MATLQWLVQSLLYFFVNFSRNTVGLETDEKQIWFFEAVDHSFKLVNLDFVSILTGSCLRLQPEWMTQLYKSLNRFSLESGYNEQIDLLHTEDRARMHKKDAQDLSTQFLMTSFLTSSYKGRSKFSVLNETENLKARLNGMLYFSANSWRLDVCNNSCYAGKAHRMKGI